MRIYIYIFGTFLEPNISKKLVLCLVQSTNKGKKYLKKNYILVFECVVVS